MSILSDGDIECHSFYLKTISFRNIKCLTFLIKVLIHLFSYFMRIRVLNKTQKHIHYSQYNQQSLPRTDLVIHKGGVAVNSEKETYQRIPNIPCFTTRSISDISVPSNQHHSKGFQIDYTPPTTATRLDSWHSCAVC